MTLSITLLDTRHHDRSEFSCGVTALDDYLQKRARQHQQEGIATIHVLIDDAKSSQILGYCALSAAQLLPHEMREADRKRLPAWPVPAVRMGRLAMAATAHSKGYGSALLGHAVNLALSIRQTMGVRVLIVDAKNASAATFYRKHGFRPTASESLTLYLPL